MSRYHQATYDDIADGYSIVVNSRSVRSPAPLPRKPVGLRSRPVERRNSLGITHTRPKVVAINCPKCGSRYMMNAGDHSSAITTRTRYGGLSSFHDESSHCPVCRLADEIAVTAQTHVARLYDDAPVYRSSSRAGSRPPLTSLVSTVSRAEPRQPIISTASASRYNAYNSSPRNDSMLSTATQGRSGRGASIVSVSTRSTETQRHPVYVSRYSLDDSWLSEGDHDRISVSSVTRDSDYERGNRYRHSDWDYY